jgi:hypothetical protein
MADKNAVSVMDFVLNFKFSRQASNSARKKLKSAEMVLQIMLPAWGGGSKEVSLQHGKTR